MNRHDIFFLSGLFAFIFFLIYLYLKNKFIKYINRNVVIVPYDNHIPIVDVNNNIQVLSNVYVLPIVPDLPINDI